MRRATACRSLRALPASRTFGADPLLLTTYCIDADAPGTVTRETVLRYMVNSLHVNLLVVEKSWLLPLDGN
jgi:hypothetical protein